VTSLDRKVLGLWLEVEVEGTRLGPGEGEVLPVDEDGDVDVVGREVEEGRQGIGELIVTNLNHRHQ
jgi:hypothetical protein